jgi:leishmanolysin-like peptidase
MIGKWGVGFFAPAYLPISRGFDTSSGFLGSGEDHFNQRADGAGCAVDFWKNEAPDHRNGTYDAWVCKDDIAALFPTSSAALLPSAAAPPPPPPMFLFMAFHNVHSPMQAPQWLIDQQPAALCSTRRTLHAMVAAVDNVTATLVGKLKEHRRCCSHRPS